MRKLKRELQLTEHRPHTKPMLTVLVNRQPLVNNQKLPVSCRYCELRELIYRDFI